MIERRVELMMLCFAVVAFGIAASVPAFAADECHAGAWEVCDGIDNDCDGEVDEYITNCDTASIPGPPSGEEPRAAAAPVEIDRRNFPEGCADEDRDGWSDCPAAEQRDCDDGDPDVGPDAWETCNGLDDNCDGLVDEDITNCTTADVPGPPSGIEPRALLAEPEEDLGPLPADCHDLDGDGWPNCGDRYWSDCDDLDSSIHVDAWETCDGVDNDCNGFVDDSITNCPTAEIPGPPAGVEPRSEAATPEPR